MDTTDIDIIRNHAALAAYAVHHGSAVHVTELCPGNGTRYLMVLSALDHATGNPAAVGGTEDRHVLSLPYFGTSYPVNLPGYFTEGYVASKWTRGNETDGAVVAEFLTYLSNQLRVNAELPEVG